MRVYNLTSTALRFHTKTIPPDGGFEEFPELDRGFIPDRDRALETSKVISFGGLPKGWSPARRAIAEPPKAKPEPKPAPVAPPAPSKPQEAEPSKPVVSVSQDFRSKKK